MGIAVKFKIRILISKSRMAVNKISNICTYSSKIYLSQYFYSKLDYKASTQFARILYILKRVWLLFGKSQTGNQTAYASATQ
jgi:hypothetical protein